MLTKNNISEYNNKYYIIDDGWSVVYLYVREAEGYDYEDFGDIIATADTLEQHRTLIFKGVKIEISSGSVYYEDGTLIEVLSSMKEINFVDFNEGLKEVKKSIKYIGICE